MNIDNIFNAFNANDEEIFRNEDNADELINDNFIKVGVFIKGVQNYDILDNMYSFKFGNQYESVKEKLKHKYYLGLVQNLPRPGELQSKTVSDLEEEFEKGTINYALSELIDYFVEIEDFDSCIILKEYLDLFGLKKLDLS